MFSKCCEVQFPRHGLLLWVEVSGVITFPFPALPKWDFLCCGQCKALLCSVLLVVSHLLPPKSKAGGLAHLWDSFFFSGTTFQGHNCTQCHSREPGCVSKPICFMCCFLFFSHSPLFCLLSLNCGDSRGQIRTFLPGEIKEGLLEAWLSLFQLKKKYKIQTFQHLLEPAQMYMHCSMAEDLRQISEAVLNTFHCPSYFIWKALNAKS